MEEILRLSTSNGGQLAPVSSEVSQENTSVILDSGSTAPEVNKEPPASEEHNQAQQSGQSAATSPSWWGYLGWSNVNETQEATPNTSAPDVAPINGVPPEPDTSQCAPEQDQSQCTPASPAPQPEDNLGTPTTPSTIQASSGTLPLVQQDVKPSTGDQLSTDAEQTPVSITSGETARSQGSAWYSPWAWYSSQPAAGTSDQIVTDSGGEGSPERQDENTKTESEIVKEEALARPEIQAVVITEPTPKVEVPNPIESAALSNPSGWLSFFTSRTFTKTITDQERDENGIEVMNIDEDEDTSSGQAVQVLPLGETATRGRHSPTPSLSRNSVAKSGDEIPAAPLTNSEAIKRKATRKDQPRSASQASTTRSTASVPAKPPPPNLVLPTWEDTFHVPPRSIVPKPVRSSRSKLQKTLSLVGGALWSKSESAENKAKGKGKAGEGQAEFMTFGQELPKALDVVGEQLSPYILNGGCRVVVIGVYGWSPGIVSRPIRSYSNRTHDGP